MSLIVSKNDEENDALVKTGVYQSGGAAVSAGETGIGGTTTASETFDRIGTAATEFNDAGAINGTAGNTVDNTAYDVVNDNSPLKWIVPLAIVLLLIISGYAFCGSPQSVTESGAAASVNAG